jgi:hypothetical protein
VDLAFTFARKARNLIRDVSSAARERNARDQEVRAGQNHADEFGHEHD